MDDRINIHKYFVSYRFGYPIGLGTYRRMNYEFGQLIWNDEAGIMTTWQLDKIIDYIANVECSERGYPEDWKNAGIKITLICVNLLAVVKM